MKVAIRAHNRQRSISIRNSSSALRCFDQPHGNALSNDPKYLPDWMPLSAHEVPPSGNLAGFGINVIYRSREAVVPKPPFAGGNSCNRKAATLAANTYQGKNAAGLAFSDCITHMFIGKPESVKLRSCANLILIKHCPGTWVGVIDPQRCTCSQHPASGPARTREKRCGVVWTRPTWQQPW